MVWLIHESQREQEFKRHNGIDKRCFARADRVVFVCRATQKVYQDLEHENNFVTIYNGLDLDAVEHYRSTSDRLALRRQYGFRERDPLVVNIGSICKRKDQGTFVRAARSLLARRDEGLQFLMIGSTKPEPDYVAEIRRLIPDGRPGSIRIVEETTAVFDYYRMADILVCTSRIESMPLVILEAMAFELPIVSTNVFGIPEAVEDEKSALLAEPGDWNGIADRIERLLQDGKKAEALAGNAKKRVEEKFRLQRCVEEHIALAEEMLREKAKTTT
jgi:glycosyltransferase involved in cell wall biosynthesis